MLRPLAITEPIWTVKYKKLNVRRARSEHGALINERNAAMLANFFSMPYNKRTSKEVKCSERQVDRMLSSYWNTVKLNSTHYRKRYCPSTF